VTADSHLATALAAEHAAIFGYGTIGARLSGPHVAAARAAEAVHRTRRDALLVRLGADAPAAQPAYAMPFPVVDQTSAARLGVLIEERCAQAWQACLGPETGAERQAALTALTDCATRAAAWRRLAGVTPALVPFPGRT
jgi:hypothetical protein